MFFRQPSCKVRIPMKIIAVLMSFMLAGAEFAGERPATKPGFEKQILDVTYGETEIVLVGEKFYAKRPN
jgi:hypothetical protein